MQTRAGRQAPLPDLWQADAIPPGTSGFTRHVILPISVPAGLDDLPTRFRRLDNWSTSHGFLTVIPTYEDRETDAGVILSGLAISSGGADKTDGFYLKELAAMATDHGNLPANALWHQQLSLWASLNGSAAACPTFQLGENERKGMYTGGLLFSDRTAEVRRVHPAELGDVSSYPARLRSIQAYARSQGFAGGFPSYVDEREADKIGVVLLKPEVAKPVSIPAEDLR